MKETTGRAYQEGAPLRKTVPFVELGVVVLVALLLLGIPRLPSDWTSIGEQQVLAISGLTRMSGNPREFLVVHDNKRPAEHRLATIVIDATVQYRPIAWPSGYALPIDLEALSPLPGSPTQFLVATSGGTVTLLDIRDGRAELRSAFTLPERPGLPNFEGLSVQQIGSTLVAAWGQRGAGAEAGRLFWGRFELEPMAVRDVAQAEIRVPYPLESNPNTRHISDLEITREGEVWISATNDPGDDGPFESAVYSVGRLVASDAAITFTRAESLTPFRKFSRKVEAIELSSDGRQVIVGTDDERNGGAVASFAR